MLRISVTCNMDGTVLQARTLFKLEYSDVTRQIGLKCTPHYLAVIFLFFFSLFLKAANGHDDCAEALLHREADALCR